VADRVSALIRGDTGSAQYGGNGMCYLEFGRDQVARVNVTFLSGQKPIGSLEGPSEELAADKVEFGRSRIKRWFGRTWPEVEQPVS
ncbi:MAG: NAD(P)/FAD-dependent oxidoreductase, partial [Acidimicrobiales bacterium]